MLWKKIKIIFLGCIVLFFSACDGDRRVVVGIGNPINPYIRVFNEREMLFMGMLNYVDKRYRTENFNLTIRGNAWNENFIETEEFFPTTLLEVRGNEVRFKHNLTYYNGFWADQPVIAVDGPIFTGGVIYQPSVGLNTFGSPYFPISFKVLQPFQTFYGAIPGNGRVVDNYFSTISDPYALLNFVSTYVDSQDQSIIGDIVFGNKIYGSFLIRYRNGYLPSALPNRAEIKIKIYWPPIII